MQIIDRARYDRWYTRLASCHVQTKCLPFRSALVIVLQQTRVYEATQTLFDFLILILTKKRMRKSYVKV